MASDSEDMKKMLRTLNRLTEAIESSSMTGGAYKVRHGRGGNSNGVSPESGPDSLRNEKEALKRATEKYRRAVERNNSTLEMWQESLRKATGVNKIFGESVKATAERIDAKNKNQSAATLAVTKATIKLAREYGIHSQKVQDISKHTSKFSSAMDKLIDKHYDKLRIEYEVDNEIAALRKARNAENAKSRAKNKELIASLDEQIEELKRFKATLPEIEEAIDGLQNEMLHAAKAAGDLTPAFEGVSDATEGVINAKGDERIAVDKLLRANKELTPRLKAQVNAITGVNEKMLALKVSIQDAADGIGESVVKIGKAIGASLPKIIDNFRDQLKYNVKESNYISAAEMGMAEGDLSRVLGQNADVFRGVSGSGDNRALLLDGTLKDLHRTINRVYGESGAQAVERIAQIASTNQGSGFNSRENPGLLDQRIKSFADMSDRLAMTKDELANFASQLSDSGDMAYLAGKYMNLSATEAQAALDRELEARIANAKMLGLSTEHVKTQIQLERRNRYGTMENQIQSMLGGRMDATIARRNGVNVSPEMEALIEKRSLGIQLTADEQSKLGQYDLASRNAMETRIQTAGANGDRAGIFGQGMMRTLSRNFGSETYTEEGMMQAQQQRAAIRAKYTKEEWEQFEKDGTVSKIYQQHGGLASDPNSTNSSLLVLDQYANIGKTIWDGLTANPIMSGIFGGVMGILANTTAILMRMGGLGRLSRGIRRARVGGKLLGRRLARSGVGKSALGFGRTAMGVGSNVGSRILTNVGGVGRLAAGGIAGAGVGLLGMGLSNLGNNAKTAGLANGDLTNDTIFDKATAGATADIAGRALSYGATGAMIGSIIPGVGTAVGGAIGAVVGAGMGVVDNFDVIKSNFETLKDGIVGPSATLEKVTKEAAEARASVTSSPTEVVLTGEQAEAILKAGANSDKLVETNKEQLNETKKAAEFGKSKAQIEAMMQSQRASVDATRARFTNAENT